MAGKQVRQEATRDLGGNGFPASEIDALEARCQRWFRESFLPEIWPARRPL
jgi:hypothetical protein